LELLLGEVGLPCASRASASKAILALSYVLFFFFDEPSCLFGDGVLDIDAAPLGESQGVEEVEWGIIIVVVVIIIVVVVVEKGKAIKEIKIVSNSSVRES